MTAWVLGMWIADGTAASCVITQIGEDTHHPSHYHRAVIDKLSRWYADVMRIERILSIAPGSETLYQL